MRQVEALTAPRRWSTCCCRWSSSISFALGIAALIDMMRRRSHRAQSRSRCRDVPSVDGDSLARAFVSRRTSEVFCSPRVCCERWSRDTCAAGEIVFDGGVALGFQPFRYEWKRFIQENYYYVICLCSWVAHKFEVELHLHSPEPGINKH